MSYRRVIPEVLPHEVLAWRRLLPGVVEALSTDPHDGGGPSSFAATADCDPHRVRLFLSDKSLARLLHGGLVFTEDVVEREVTP